MKHVGPTIDWHSYLIFNFFQVSVYIQIVVPHVKYQLTPL